MGELIAIFMVLIIISVIISGIQKIFSGNKRKTKNNSSYSSTNRKGRMDDHCGRGVIWGGGGRDNCSHVWSYTHKGADGNNIYRCSRCDREEKRMT